MGVNPRSSCSLFQTNSGVNYSDNSVFFFIYNTYDYSFENGKHNSSDSFLLFPQIDDEHKTQDFSSLFKTDEFKGSKNTLQSYFNADYMISTNRECEDIKEENNNSTNFILKKKRKIIKKGILRKNSKKIYKCEHINCPLSFKTHKQRYNHHKKMCIECHKDTLNMLKGIKQIKEIYNTIIKIKYSKVIEVLEEKLPVKPFTDEFTGIQEYRSKKIFMFSDIQKIVSIIGAIFFFAIFISEITPIVLSLVNKLNEAIIN